MRQDCPYSRLWRLIHCSFLVADRVYVASLAAKSSNNPVPSQYVFSSSADESSFEIYPDPRGNFLGRGTEITLVLKDDALEYTDTHKITELVYVVFVSRKKVEY